MARWSAEAGEMRLKNTKFSRTRGTHSGAGSCDTTTMADNNASRAGKLLAMASQRPHPRSPTRMKQRVGD